MMTLSIVMRDFEDAGWDMHIRSIEGHAGSEKHAGGEKHADEFPFGFGNFLP